MENKEYEWVTVYRPANDGDLAVAKSILEGSSIPCFVRGEATSGVWGVQLLAEGAQVQVPRDRLDDAIAVLDPLLRET